MGTSKRIESMTGLDKLDYDELNIENLRQFNANIARDTDDEDADNMQEDAMLNEEEKESQPHKPPKIIKHDTESLASQHGSDDPKQDINVDEHTLGLQSQPDEEPVPPIENMNIEEDHNLPKF